MYDDMLFAMSKHFPGMLDEVDGLSAFIGILVDEKTIVIHIVRESNSIALCERLGAVLGIRRIAVTPRTMKRDRISLRASDDHRGEYSLLGGAVRNCTG